MAISALTKDQIVATVRRRVGDTSTPTSDVWVADGLTATFPLSTYPCVVASGVSGVTVYKNSTLLASGYTMSSAGVLEFSVGNVPSAGDTLQAYYQYTKLSDDEVWNFVADGVYMVNATYDFGGTLETGLLTFTQDPAPIAGTVYGLQASILILQNNVKPLSGGEGILIRHGDETIDTKTAAIGRKEQLKGMQGELNDLITRYMMGISEPWLIA